MYNFSFLLLLSVIPLMSIIMIIIIDKDQNIDNEQLLLNIHYTAIWTAFLIVLLSFVIIIFFDFNVYLFQFVETEFLFLNTGYKLGIDGISLFFILLSSIFFLLSIIIISNNNFAETYHACILLLIVEVICIILFTSLNLLSIIIFFEISSICLYISFNDRDSGISNDDLWKIFLTLSFANALALVSICYIYNQIGTLNIDELMLYEFSYNEKLALWTCIFVSSLVRIGIIPLSKSWIYFCNKKLSMLLCCMIVNACLYIIFRVCITLFSSITYSIVNYIAIPLLLISVFNNIAISQNHIQKIILSHIPVIILSLCLGKDGIIGTIFYLIGYNIINFSLIIFLYEQNSKLSDFYFQQRSALICLISIASGFLPSAYLVGYLIILQSLFEISGPIFSLGIIIGILLFSNSVLMYSNLLYHQLNIIELTIIVILIILAICIGIFPNIVTNLLSYSFFMD